VIRSPPSRTESAVPYLMGILAIVVLLAILFTIRGM
jgi:hypothetical protein